MSEIIRPRGVGVLIQNADGFILTVSRKGRLEDLTLPGGKPVPGESLANAAIREVGEEVAVRVARLQQLYEGVALNGKEEWVTTTYRALSWSGKPRAVEPDTQIAWLTREKLLSLRGTFHSYYVKLFASLES